MFRILNTLRSIQYRQSQRIDLWLLRAGFILLVVFWGLTATLSWSQKGQLDLGHTMSLWFFPASLILLAYLAGRLNRETVGDSNSGYLSLIAMSGTTRTQWTCVRFLQNLIGFLSVWIVRIPFLFLFFTLGGLRLETLIFNEILFLLLFCGVTARSMLVSHNTDNRKTADWSGVVTLFLLELSLHAGRLAVKLLFMVGIQVPALVYLCADWMHELSILQWFFSVRTAGPMTVSWSVRIGFYILLTAYWLAKYRRIVFDRIGESPEPALESKKEKRKALKARPPLLRCWDDALAWQSYVYYSGGHDNTTGRVILYGFVFVFVTFCVVSQLFTPIMVILLIGSGIIFLNAMNGVSHCFDKEVKANTLSSLIMTPHKGLDLYRGWRRGILWLTIPDHVYACLLMVLMLFVESVISYVILNLIITIHLSGPLLMLSGLVPMNWKSLGVACLVICGLIVCVAIGITFAAATHPALFSLAFLPLYALFNSLLLHQFVEKWFRIRIAQEV